MAQAEVTRKLAAIIYADVAGYSRLTGADEEGTHKRLSAYLDAIAEAIDGHGGKVLHYAGDAVLAEFQSVVSALSCAVNVQRDLAARNDGLPDDQKLQFRFGVNMGDVIADRDELYGDGVNIAARLESLAEPGGICVSGTAYEQVKGKLPLKFDSLGSKSLKNIAEPVRVYRVRPSAAPGEGPEEPAAADRDPPAEEPIYQWTGYAAFAFMVALIAAIVWWYR